MPEDVVDGGLYELKRGPCSCGCAVGRLRRVGLQDTVRCAQCDRYLYNAPRSETGLPAKNSKRRKRDEIGVSLRFDILARDGFRCRYCGATADHSLLHVDHVVPVIKGGTNAPENLVTSCQDCNLGKGAKQIGGGSQ